MQDPFQRNDASSSAARPQLAFTVNSRPPGLVAKAVALVTACLLVAVGLVFSVIVFAVVIAAVLGFLGWVSWKRWRARRVARDRVWDMPPR